MARAIVAVLVMIIGSSAFAGAQSPESVAVRAEYVSGQPGFTKRLYDGVLMIEGDALVFSRARAKGFRVVHEETFRIPLATITAVSNTIDTNGPNAAAVAMLGVMALGSKRQDEHIYVTTETETRAGVVIFKLKKNTSADTVAKINFALKRAARTEVDRDRR